MPIVTNTRGLVTGAVEIPGLGKLIPAYYAAPQIGKSFPLILVLHQIYGMNEYTRDICRQFAKAGYLAVMPDLYCRYGNATGLSREEINERIASRVDDQQILSDLDAVVTWSTVHYTNSNNWIGVTGFAWGAQFVWLYAAHNPNVKAGVCWYGRLVRTVNSMRPTPWRQTVADLKAPVLGIYAGFDPNISIGTLNEMRRALASAPVATEIVFFPEARHGFHADYQPHYRPKDASEAWQHQMEWFRKYSAFR